MAEGEDEGLVAKVIDEICEAILTASTGTEAFLTRSGQVQAAG